MTIQLRHASLALVLASSACVAGGHFHLGGSSGSSGASSDPAVASSDTAAAVADATPAAATPATKFSDFAFEVKDATGEYYTGWIIDKLTKFDVSKACYQRMLDHDKGALHTATFFTRDIAALALTLTGDDWSHIESQSGGREKNKKLVEPMVESFKNNFGLTVSVDGDDCDDELGALWVKYWGEVASILKDNPPASGKAFVKLVIRGDVKDLKIDVDDDTSTYTITAPRDIEKPGWPDKLEKPFRKRARQK